MDPFSTTNLTNSINHALGDFFIRFFWIGVIALGIGIIVWLLLREVKCWYFKINKIVSLLEDIKINTTPKEGVGMVNSKDTNQNTITPNLLK